MTALGVDTTLNITNVTFVGNALGLRIAPNHAGAITSDLIFEDNDAQYVLLDGSTPGSNRVNRPQQWRALTVPYRVANVAYIEREVTIDPGTTLEFAQNTGLEITDGGRLLADADGFDPIMFKGAEDINGFWKGLHFERSFSTANILANTVVQHGGSSGWHGAERSRANIFLSGGSDKAMLTIRNTVVRGSGHYGISVENDAVLADCASLEFDGNTQDDLNGQDTAVVCAE